MYAITDGNVLFNALQIAHAERYVFSPDGNFKVVDSIFKDAPSLQRRLRFIEAIGEF